MRFKIQSISNKLTPSWKFLNLTTKSNMCNMLTTKSNKCFTLISKNLRVIGKNHDLNASILEI